MRKSKRYRRMQEREYEAVLFSLKERHPWLVRQVFEPAPGHLSLVEHLIEQMECLLSSAVLKRRGTLCVTQIRDRLAAYYQLPSDHAAAPAVMELIAETKNLSLHHCPVCGVPVSGNGTSPQRCERHENQLGLFAEDLRPSQQQKIDEEGLRQVVRDLGKLTAEDTRPFVKEGEGVQQTTEEGKAPTTDPVETEQRPTIVFLDGVGLEAFVDRHRPKSDEKLRRAQAIRERIKRAGHERRQLGLLPLDWEALMDDFEAAFPNFRELAEVLRDHFALSSLGDRRANWPPVLLVGPAGIGKTEAARWLADWISLPFRVFDMASTQSSSPLAGSEAFWNNSEPGTLFELLAYQPLANPVVVLDELDKVGRQQYDPLAALYTLLEPRSARNFIDLSIRDFSIDASHVNWIATANELTSIPDPILSRLTVLHIPSPTPKQVGSIAQSIYARLRDEASWGNAFIDKLDIDVLEKLQTLDPRSLGLALRRALGAAARDGRGIVQVNDITLPTDANNRGMGFIRDGLN